MTAKFNSNIGSARAANIAKSDVVDINAYRKVKKSDIYPSIIILSKDDLVCASVSRVLGAVGARVDVVNDALCFSRLFQAGSFDLVFIDGDLEWLTGDELCAIIKKYSKYNNIPILLLSDKGHKTEDDLAADVGVFDGVVPKPINAVQLISVVNIFFNEMNKTIDSK